MKNELPIFMFLLLLTILCGCAGSTQPSDVLKAPDLDQLKHMTSLKVLNLNNVQISDISALSGLTKLTTLWIDGNLIKDTSVLGRLTNLHTLGLRENRVEDVAALSALTNLRLLHLSNNPLTDAQVDELRDAIGCEIVFSPDGDYTVNSGDEGGYW